MTGALTGMTDLTLTGDITMSTGKGVKSSTTTAHTVGMYVYDVGVGYVNGLELTNSGTPATVLGNTSGTTAISSNDWTISTGGNAAGLGTIGADGLITATGGLTLSGTVSVNDAATTATTSIGAGNTTGAIVIGTGAAAKTVSMGSSDTTSTTTILGGSGGVNVNVGTFNDPTNINTGLNTGTVTVGGTGAMSIAIGDGGTGAKTITIGDAAGAGSTVIKAGTGNLDLSAVDDVSLNGGSAGSVIDIGVNVQGNVINVGTDDSAADAISVGSAKDTITVDGVSVTVGTTTGASATIIQSGTGNLALTSTDDITLTTNTTTTDNITITNTPGTETGAIALVATAGGVTIDAAAAKILDVAGGTVQIDSKTEGAGAIALLANQGVTDTITITATQSTAAGGVTLSAPAGGILLTSSAGMTTSDPVTGDGTAALTGFLVDVVNDTEPHAILVTESGSVLTNLGSNGSDAWTLPTAAAGYEYTFVVMAAQEMRITPAGGDLINHAGTAMDAAEYYTANAVGETLHLIAVDATNWIVISETGTWVEQNP
jgi:hypothetical protein